MLTNPTAYQEIFEYLKTELVKNLGSPIEIDNSSLLGNYLHLLSVLGEDAIFYLNLLHNETFLTKALLPSSIYEHALSLGYTPKPAIPTKGIVRVHIPLENLSKFKTDKMKWEFVSNDPLITYESEGEIQLNFDMERNILLAELFTPMTKDVLTSYINQVTYEDNVFSAWTILVPVIQARTVDITYVIKDTDIQDYALPTIKLNLLDYFTTDELEKYQIGEVTTIVNNVRYNSYRSIFEVPRGEAGFVAKIDADSITINLGNGIFGRKEDVGNVVKISLQVTAGSSGGVSANELTLSTQLIDVLTKGVLQTYTSHIDIPKGTDRESYNEIRINTIRSLRSRDRLVSTTDGIDLVKLSFPSFAIDALPVVRTSDLSANETTLFLVPHINNIPLKVSTIPLVIPTSTNKLVSFEQQIAYEGINWIVPFDIYKDTYALQYIYIPPYVRLSPTTKYRSAHSLSPLLTFTVASINFDYDRTNELYNISLYCRITVEEDEEITENLIRQLFPSVTLKLQNTTTNNIYTLQTWTISDIQSTSTQATFTLNTTLANSLVQPHSYILSINIEGEVLGVRETLYDGYASSIYLKVDFSSIFNIRYRIAPQSGDCPECIIMNDVPVFEITSYFEKRDLIHTVLFSYLIQFKNWIDSRRMITNKVNIAWARTYGKIRNLLYNPPIAAICYTPECENNLPNVPLKIEAHIVVSKDASALEVLNNVRSAIWDEVKIGGIHKSLLRETLLNIITSVRGVLSAKLIHPTIPIYYEFDPNIHIPKTKIRNYVPEFIWIESIDDIVVHVVEKLDVIC